MRLKKFKMGKEAIFLFASIVFISFVVEMTVGCGMTTHTEIGHRATKYFEDKRGNFDYKQLILENQPAFQAGNPYPDAFFPSICRGGKFHYVSEDTHWTPFMLTTIDYIRDEYPKPWDEHARKLVAFLLGFASHQVADVAWHSLDIDQGFLTTMGDINFFGSFPDAHQVGDVGSDVLAESELELDYISAITDWYIPVKDLFEIYKIYFNGTVIMHEDVIIECTTIIFLARLGEQIDIFSKIYDYISSTSPFLTEEYENYFLGGVDGMATMTETVWHETIYMLENGTSVCNVPNNAIYINCSGLMPTVSRSRQQSAGWSTSLRGSRNKLTFNNHGLDMNDVNVTVSSRGIYLSPSDSVKAQLKLVSDRVHKERHSKSNSSAFAKQPTAAFSIKTTYARLGSSIATGEVNGDKNEDLIIGAPGYGMGGMPQLGRVYVLYGSDEIYDKGSLDLDQDSDVILQGFHSGGKFGSAVAALDLNLDGYTDIAVGAPSVGSKNLTYTGEVYVFYGNKAGKLSTVPNVTITCKLRYCNLGWSLSSGDFDLDGHLDLLVGTPYAPANDKQQAGMVSVLLAGSNFKNENDVHLTEKDMNVTIWGDQEYSWFGRKVSLRTKPGLEPLLLMSQPTYRICANPDCSYSPKDTQSVGSLSIYNRRSNVTTVVRGKDTFAKLGAAMATGDPFGNGSLVLAIASDTQDVQGKIAGIPNKFPQTGKVSLYNVEDHFSSRHPRGHGPTNGSMETFSTYEGDRRYGRFGGEVMFEDVTGDGIDDLVVSAPFRTEDISGEVFKVEEGIVYVYQGGPSFSVGDVTSQCNPLTLVHPCPSDKAYAVLTSGKRGSRFGSKMAAWKFNEKTHLVVSAPRSDNSDRLAGEVYIYTI